MDYYYVTIELVVTDQLIVVWVLLFGFMYIRNLFL